MPVIPDPLRPLFQRLNDPVTGSPLADSPALDGLTIRNQKAFISFSIDPAQQDQWEPVRKDLEAALPEQEGLIGGNVILTSQREGVPNAPPPQGTPHAPDAPPPGPPPRPARPANREPLMPPGVKNVILVASGKGGVGKSTTAVNLAAAFAHLGLRTGVLDADIYGPSMAKMLQITDKATSDDGKKIEPASAWGLRVMSMGLLIGEDTPVIWRGPMAQSALVQLFTDVNWGALDVLVVDMPPGTGDIQLTIAQRLPQARALIVSTPQDIALVDVRKGIAMFAKVHLSILGIIENMSGFACPNCGTVHDIFGQGGAKAQAKELDVPFLGKIPLDMPINQACEAGKPIVVADPKATSAQAYLNIAKRVAESLE
ncbi:MAG: Mrp/NBP35 family ATP-binding protein [Pseudomonadota bacterium]